MTDVKNRPKHLNLLVIKQPVAAIVSILHRISGALLFLLLPFFLAALHMSLWPDGFLLLKSWLQLPVLKLVVIVVSWALLHHICAGIRFLLIDIHIGVDKAVSQGSAKVVLGVSLLLTALFAWRVVL